MRNVLSILFLMLLCGCTSTLGTTQQPAPMRLAVLPEGCSSPGEIVRAELSQPTRGYPYSYRVYLPPCFDSENGARYPVLYLIPGRGSSPDHWINAGLTGEVDRLILTGDVPPFLLITTENTDSDPMAETIYRELIPFVESQYPLANDRRTRAVAGGSLGGIAAYRLAFQYPDTFSSAGIFGAGAISGEEERIRTWLAQMNDTNRTRVFMNSGERDPFMLARARVMKSILDEVGVENQLFVDDGEHNYPYWIRNFAIYLKWLAKEW